jgi:hypothetical protein
MGGYKKSITKAVTFGIRDLKWISSTRMFIHCNLSLF